MKRILSNLLIPSNRPTSRPVTSAALLVRATVCGVTADLRKVKNVNERIGRALLQSSAMVRRCECSAQKIVGHLVLAAETVSER